MNSAQQIYTSIAERTGGDIYIGVVGPVRTGKSTFIQKFMDLAVLPNIEKGALYDRAVDELPQSSDGRTIMTTEPKFVPEQAVRIELPDKTTMRVRLIDCVGYIVPGALGYIEEQQPRMIVSPWFDEPVPFELAAETGTRKVIAEHSTIGIVVTTDGSIADIAREDYVPAEQRVVSELRELGKPFAVLLNCARPHSAESKALAEKLQGEYRVPVIAVNCLELGENELTQILGAVASQFPIKEIRISMPGWVSSLESGHWLQNALFSAVSEFAGAVGKMSDIGENLPLLENCEYVSTVRRKLTDLGSGSVHIELELQPDLFYKVLSERTGLCVADESSLMRCIAELCETKKRFSKIEGALQQAQATGYGIVMPGIDELKLQEPEIVRQGGRYGVKLRASAPSIHIWRSQNRFKDDKTAATGVNRATAVYFFCAKDKCVTAEISAQLRQPVRR